MDEDQSEKLAREVIEKLNILLKLNAMQIAVDKSAKERARLLKLAGLDNRTIATVLNTSLGTVRVFTVKLHAKRKELQLRTK